MGTDKEQIFSGANVEKAVAAGLTALGLVREQVEVEVLDQGAHGILGIGSRPARVRLKPLARPPAEVASTPRPSVSPPAEPDVAGVAQAVLAELLQRLGFVGEIRVHQAEPASDEEESPLVLDVYGPGADELIGRKGETLAALQHVVRLMVGRRTSGQVNLVLDVEGYKERRGRNLRRLAQRMADQAIKTGRTVTLEPMPAYERRIVHLALRDHPQVTTQSVGVGERRRVTIIPRPGKEG